MDESSGDSGSSRESTPPYGSRSGSATTEKSGDVSANSNAGGGAKPKVKTKAKTRKKAMKKRTQPSDEDDQIVAQLSDMVLHDTKPTRPVTTTGFISDPIMTQHKSIWLPQHQECPERISVTVDRCESLGLVDRCKVLQTRYATEDHILLHHTPEYLDIVRSTAGLDVEGLKDVCKQFSDIYINPMTYECALVSLGCTIELTENVIKENIRNGLAVVRPPGHHAQSTKANGYSFFNNVAIAAELALEEFHLKRMLIVDWDVHHGQGTQDLFYDDPRVLVISIHRYEYGEFWPCLRRSDYDYVGSGAGEGFNINLPLNQIELGIGDYMAMFQQVILPVAYEFEPHLVFVSAGYDAAYGCPEFSPDLVLVSCGMDSALGDPKGDMSLEPPAYAHLLHCLRGLAEGRICCILEGGYCLQSLAEGVAMTLRELLGDPCPVIGPIPPPCDSVCATILNVIKEHRKYWKCFQYQIIDDEEMCPYEEVNSAPPKDGVLFDNERRPPEGFSLINVQDFLTTEEKAEIKLKLDAIIAETSLYVPPHRTGFVFDTDMRAHKNSGMTNHPESPDRISRIFEHHVDSGLYKLCHRIESRAATLTELQLIHQSHYVEEIKSTTEKTPTELYDLQCELSSVYLCQESYKCACLATGCVLNLVDSVLTGQTLNGVAVVRPPGHHAESQFAMGFCLFNTVAIAAQYARTKHSLERILIVDWDVHHGNGTQHSFNSDPHVLFISLHRFENGMFYPGSQDGGHTNVGFGPGAGYNVNIPWSHQKMGDAEYIAAFQQVVMPIAYQFAPQLVLVSAGFDAARGDPLGGYNITPEGYAHMTHMLTSLAGGRVILVLEGGYNLTSISVSMAACTSVLLGDPCPTLDYHPPNTSAVQTIRNVLDVQKFYWPCIKFRVPIPNLAPADVSSDNFADVSTTDDHSFRETRHQEKTRKLKNKSKRPSSGHQITSTPAHLKQGSTDNKISCEDSHMKAETARQSAPNICEKGSSVKVDEQTSETISDNISVDSTKDVATEHQQTVNGKNSAYLSQTSSQEPNSINTLNSLTDNLSLLSRGETSNLSLPPYSDISLPPHSDISLPPHCDISLPAHSETSNISIPPSETNTDNTVNKSQNQTSNISIPPSETNTGNTTNKSPDETPYQTPNETPTGSPTKTSDINDSLQLLSEQNCFDSFTQDLIHNLAQDLNLSPFSPVSGSSDYTTADDDSILLNLKDTVLHSKADDDSILLNLKDTVLHSKADDDSILMNLKDTVLHSKADDDSILLNLKDTVLHSKADDDSILLNPKDTVLHLKADAQSGYNPNNGGLVHSTSDSANNDCLVRSTSNSITNVEKTHTSVKIDRPSPNTENLYKLNINENSKIDKDTNKMAETNEGDSNLTSDKSHDAHAASGLAESSPQATNELQGACGGSDEVPVFLGYLQEGTEGMFAVVPLTWCPHLPSVQPLPRHGLDAFAPCVDCDNVGENWVCLECYTVGCSRYVNEHMVHHGQSRGHNIVLSYADISVWCYKCDSYVDNPVLCAAKASACDSKFAS